MQIFHDRSLREWNTFGMKVSCSCFVEYSSVEELKELWHGLHDFPSPFLHIGRGSNILFTKDFSGTIFHSGIRFIEVMPHPEAEAAPIPDRETDEVQVEVGAGVTWDDFCGWCADRNLWGPENLSGIPGETGAAAVQNIGAYGVEAKDIIRYVKCLDCVTGSMVTFKTSECRYGYRESMFKTSAKGRYIVTSVIFALSRTSGPRLDYGHVREAVETAVAGKDGRHDAEECTCGTDRQALTPALVRDVILSVRESKLPDPAVIGSAGSFFKNPVVPRSDYERIASIARIEHGEDFVVPHYDAGSGFIKVPAAWLIEQCGWKGHIEGNAGVYGKQPLVLINATGNASPDEIIALENRIADSVMRKFGIALSPEVEHV